ncbi:MAG: hypothetical protein HY735_27320 [Verrucomicrobia bacterium]|nr:hypothetical protein [Verrucomicrobiota bacterium]
MLTNEVWGSDQQLPTPLAFRNSRKILFRIAAPPLTFQFADRVVLLSGELAGHFDREGCAVKRADFFREHGSARFALAADS